VEPCAEKLLTDGLATQRIAAFREIGDRLDRCDLALVCVGTPSAPDGSHDMTHIAEVTRQIAAATSPRRSQSLTLAYRSTVRPGTIEGLIEPIFRAELGHRVRHGH
jgi:GDP-mannose 6-dehydrogenase